MLVVWFLLFLGLSGAERIRILNTDTDLQDDPAALNAFKSKIRSLTLRSSFERLLAKPSDEESASRQKHPKKVTKFLDESTTYMYTEPWTTTTDIYTMPSTTPEPTTTNTPVPPYPIDIYNDCFRLVPCCNQSIRPIPTIPPGPYPTQPPCPIPPYPIPPYPIAPTPNVPSQKTCCGIVIAIPCYICPCVSPCSVVPANNCPCQVDQRSEYKCPNTQVRAVLLIDLPEWTRQGFRPVDNLQPPPDCGNNVPGIWPVPGGYNNYFEHFPNDGEQSSNFLFRQLRQRQLPQHGAQQYGGSYGQPYQPYPPQPSYPMPPNGSYPVVPPYPPAPASYAQPTSTTTEETTTSSAALHIVSSSAVIVSLVGLLLPAFLIK